MNATFARAVKFVRWPRFSRACGVTSRRQGDEGRAGMKFLTFEHAGRQSFGCLGGGGVVDLGARLGISVPDLQSFIALGGPFAGDTGSADLALADVTFCKPLPNPGKCFCVGVNYPERNAEYKDGSERPAYPSLFVRFPESFVAHNEALRRPPESLQLDYEGEVVLVIGRPGRRIARADAMSHVFGYSIANEGTIRDWVRHGKFNVTPGKNFAASGSIGPWIVSADEVAADSLRVVTRVNGEERQNDSVTRMMFPFDYVISYISTFCTLQPGDIILTGTPAGAGARLDPPRYLAPGDVVEVEVPGIGTLRNPVADA